MQVTRSSKKNLVFIALMCVAGLVVLYVYGHSAGINSWMQNDEKKQVELRNQVVEEDSLFWFNASAVTDQQTISPWHAPIIWEDTFDPKERDKFYMERETVIGLTVFAIGRYLDKYLRKFLESAEEHYMIGHRVIYYVMVDDVTKVPDLKLAPKRTMTVVQVLKYSRWQDVSMMRMQQINNLILNRIRFEVSYLFCLDVDQFFVGRFGVEALGDSVAQVHSWWFKEPKEKYPYERRKKSDAYIALGDGDYYYHAAVFGGRVGSVYNLTQYCEKAIKRDKGNKIEAIWHDESHLNRYFLDQKPTKLLSPEYSWDVTRPQKMRYIRMKWMPKDYYKLREY